MSNAKSKCAEVVKLPADVVCKFNKDLKTQISDEWSKINSSRTMIECNEMVRGYKLCCFNMTEETYRYYRDIDNFEIFDVLKSTEIIQTNIDTYIKKNVELSTEIKTGSKLLNDLKTKLHDANNAACAMRNCLKSILGFTDDNVPKEISKVTEIAKALSSDGQYAAEALVKIAGIHTFADVAGLKDFGQKLVIAAKELKTKVDENARKAAEETRAAQTELTNSINELNNIEFRYFGENSTLNALLHTREFICEGECDPIEVVEEICKEFNDKPVETPPAPQKGKGGKYSKDDRD
jgi:uncharacterized protein Yka (UPF0111/DUF47 family)